MDIQTVAALRDGNLVGALKRKAIDKYCLFLKRALKGYIDDYSDIMDIIVLIEMPRDIDFDTRLAQYFINKI